MKAKHVKGDKATVGSSKSVSIKPMHYVCKPTKATKFTAK